MSEADELKEAAERAKESKELAPVSLTMAILAVMVATCTLLGHRAHTEEILLQTRATDQWSYYQAKNMRRNNLEALDAVLTTLKDTDPQRAAQVQKQFHEEIEKYRDQQKDIQGEARGLEAEVQHASRRADRFDLGEVFLEIGIVLSSLAILTKRKGFFFGGAAASAVGLVLGVKAYFLH